MVTSADLLAKGRHIRTIVVDGTIVGEIYKLDGLYYVHDYRKDGSVTQLYLGKDIYEYPAGTT